MADKKTSTALGEIAGRFWRLWSIIAAPLVLLGWMAGKITVAQHGYRARGLPRLADFTVHRLLGPGLATGLTLGFWAAVTYTLARFLSGRRGRTRRVLLLVLTMGLIAFGFFIRSSLPTWRAMAASAAYTGREVNLVYGVFVLALAKVVQADLETRLLWISAAGLAAALATFPASWLEARLFTKTRAEKSPRRWPARLAPLALALNLIFLAGFVTDKSHRAPADHPPVFWISIDTLRADHLSIYGYHRETDPNLKALAADGVVVEQFISQSPWTLPTHATMFSGQDPAEHGLTTQGRRFSPRTALFPELLKERGYRNGAVVTALLLSPTFGYDAGFDHYEINLTYNAAQVVRRGLRWLDKSDDIPFCFLHFFDPHYPYHPPRPFLGRFGPVSRRMLARQRGNFFDFMEWVKAKPKTRIQQAIDRYDESIAYTDHALGRFFAALKKRGLYHRSWIIVVSDHGEEFLDHGQMGHSATMYEELTRVPLIIKAPGSACAGSRFTEGQIAQSAIPKLILRVADSPDNWRDGLECHESDGVPLLVRDLAAKGPILGESRIFGPVRFMARLPESKMHSPAKIQKGRVRIQHGFELYDLSRDPGETTNIYKKGASKVLDTAMTRAINQLAAEPGAAREHVLDPETVRKLKSLGYIGD